MVVDEIRCSPKKEILSCLSSSMYLVPCSLNLNSIKSQHIVLEDRIYNMDILESMDIITRNSCPVGAGGVGYR